MASYDISIPGPDGMVVSVRLEAGNWLRGLQHALHAVTSEEVPSAAIFDIRPDGVILVTDPTTERVFFIREVEDGAPMPDGAWALESGSAPAAPPQREEPLRSSAPILRPRSETPARVPVARRPSNQPSAPPSQGPAHHPSQPRRTTAAGPVSQALARPTRPAPGTRRAGTRPGTERGLIPRHSNIAVPKAEPEEQLIEAFSEVGRGLLAPHLTPEQVIQGALDFTFSNVPCELAQLGLPLPTPGLLRIVSARGDYAANTVRAEVQLEMTILRAIGSSPGSLRMGDLASTLHYQKGGQLRVAIPVRSLIWVPIRHRKRLLSALIALNSLRPEGFLAQEVNAVDRLAEGLGKKLAEHL